MELLLSTFLVWTSFLKIYLNNSRIMQFQQCSNIRRYSLFLSFTVRGDNKKKIINFQHCPERGGGACPCPKFYLKYHKTTNLYISLFHKRTFRLIESIGPEGPCFENDQQVLIRILSLTFIFSLLNVQSRGPEFWTMSKVHQFFF